MNTQEHVHKIQIQFDRYSDFPHIFYRHYVVYGDQKVCWATTAPWRNPNKMSAEKRERLFRAAVKKVIAKHEAGTHSARVAEDANQHILRLATELTPKPLVAADLPSMLAGRDF